MFHQLHDPDTKHDSDHDTAVVHRPVYLPPPIHVDFQPRYPVGVWCPPQEVPDSQGVIHGVPAAPVYFFVKEMDTRQKKKFQKKVKKQRISTTS